MKILNAKQLAKVDAFTMNSQGLSDWELMERASQEACFELIKHIDLINDEIYIFCGTSNNGGDGLAMARILHQMTAKVQVFNVIYAPKTSQAHQKNLDLLNDLDIQVISIASVDEFPNLANASCIIDAIFGVGLNRRMPDFIQKLVKKINASKVFICAIDVPSGMYLEQAVSTEEQIVNSDLCLTFQLPKLPFLLPETGVFVENFKLIDIQLSEEKIKQTSTPYHYLTKFNVASILQKRPKFSHKGVFGNALLIGGQEGMWGSVIMSTKACLRSGIGKVYTQLDDAGQAVLTHQALEAIFVNDGLAFLSSETKLNAIGIGMGLGKSTEASQLLKGVLARKPNRLLLDADALNLLGEHSSWLENLPENSVLTPHLGELKRLIGEWENDFDRLQKVKDFCNKYKVVLIVKGAHSMICDGEHYYFNSSGNPGLAKAGSGDVLSGIITALLAQNYKVLEACQLGVYVHGLAADLALQLQSTHTLLATDVIRYLGKAFQLLESKID